MKIARKRKKCLKKGKNVTKIVHKGKNLKKGRKLTKIVLKRNRFKIWFPKETSFKHSRMIKITVLKRKHILLMLSAMIYHHLYL